MARGTVGDRNWRCSADLKLVRRVASYLAVSALGLVSIALVFCASGAFFGYRFTVVESPSMSPTLQTGDLVISKLVPADSLSPGEIVTFRNPLAGGKLFTHRVVTSRHVGSSFVVTTKGDANRIPEHWSTGRDQKLGKLEYSIPDIGRWYADLGSPGSRLTFVWLLTISLAIFGIRIIFKKFEPSRILRPNRLIGAKSGGFAVVLLGVLLSSGILPVLGSYSGYVASATNPSSAPYNQFTTGATPIVDTYSSCTGSPFSLAVPAGYTTATVVVDGAQGGSGTTYGNGAIMDGSFAVNSTETLGVYVGCMGVSGSTSSVAGYGTGGGGGTGGFAPGGSSGGGGSAICKADPCTSATLAIVAGGGAGLGGGWSSWAGSPSAGSGNSGTTGATVSPAGTYYQGNSGSGGSSGGGGGSAPPGNGSTGTSGLGCGDGGGGGGGGGYNGGGGGGRGACGGSGAGGGAGSSWAATATTITSSNGTHSGAGYIQITFT